MVSEWRTYLGESVGNGPEEEGVESEGKEVPSVRPFLYQWNGTHLPVIVERDGSEEKPKVECWQVGEGPESGKVPVHCFTRLHLFSRVSEINFGRERE